jgi:glycosyltransferase involved in cell wall biosynthesis
VRPAVSIVYSTHRSEPKFEWFADGLARQLDDDDEIEVVLVDGLVSAERRARFAAATDGRYDFTYAEPKPTAFNGRYQRTSRPLFAAANARNTGVVYASHPYLAFVDDCSVPMPGWWREVREAARHQYVVSGAYQRHRDMHVTDGVLESSGMDSSGLDSRWDLGDDRRVVEIVGGQLYTPSLGIARDTIVDVNGFDELCNGVGGEDCNLGIRLQMAGHRIFYSRRMLTVEADDLSNRGPQSFERVDPLTSERAYRDRLAELGVRRRTTDGRCDASHMALDLVYGLAQPESIGNHYVLRDLQPADLPATSRQLPTHFWFDGRPLSDL